jgi:hypothetical protein
VSCPEEIERGGSKIRSAIQKKLPIVSAQYLDDCVAQCAVLDLASSYLLVHPTEGEANDGYEGSLGQCTLHVFKDLTLSIFGLTLLSFQLPIC